MEQTESAIIYVKNSLLFPHGSMQIKRGSKGPAKNELVLLYHWSTPFDLFVYKNRRFTVGIILDIYEKNAAPWYDVKGLYTARLKKRISPHKGIHCKELTPATANEEYLVDRLRKKAQQFVFLIDIPESDKLIYLMTFISKLSELTDFISHYFITAMSDRRILYTESDIVKKADLLMNKLDVMITDVHKKKDKAERHE